MADRRITTEVVQMDHDHENLDEPEDVEFQVPHIKRRLLGEFGRPSVLDPPVSEHMKVYLRIRPFSEEELEHNESQGCLDVNSDHVITTVAPKDSHYFKKAARGQGKTITTNKFTFSRIFKEDASQKDFFNSTMLDLVKDFIDGQNCLVFSYGVTSSGKTYTIQGQPEDAGILPRALDVLFNSIQGRQWSGMDLKPDLFMGVTRLNPEQELREQKVKERIMKLSCDDDMDVASLLGHDASDMSIATNTTVSSDCSMMSCKTDSQDSMDPDLASIERVREETRVSVEDQGQIKFSIWVSFAEIYNEQIFDLLEPIPKKKNVRRPCLKLSDDQNGSPYVKGLKYINVTSADEAYKLLTIGQRNLQTACTRLNQNSSRSHCIFSIKVLRVVDKDSPHVARVSMLSLCDLAGSERYTKTKNSGERLKEAGNINTSLMTLGRCIETLKYNQLHKDHQRIIPFRDSKLTRLFQNFFVGRGKAVMIVNVNQCASMFDETQHVFKFSAIASQVIVKQNPVFLKPKLPVIVPSPKLPPRSSIMWANTPGKEKVSDELPHATNLPIPEVDDDELDTPEEVFTRENIDELLGVIAELQRDLEKEQKAKAKMETRIRKEVCDEMMTQFIEIEEHCSEQIRQREQLAEEMAEKRIQLVLNAERAKRKKDQVLNDKDDEWVSSILLHQEKIKVEERNTTIKQQKDEIKSLKDQIKAQEEEINTQAAKITAQEEEIAQLKDGEKDSKNDKLESELKELKERLEEKEMKKQKEEESSKGNLIENLTHQLQQSRERLQEQDKEVAELNDMLTEAGETFVQKEKEIEQLKELNAEYEKKLEQLKDDIKQMERVAQDSKIAMETADQSLSKREDCVVTLQAEIRDLEAEVTKYKNKARFFEEQIIQKEKDAQEWKIQYEHGQAEYSKSEEALIHGFNAEIASLKSQIFNFKTQLYGVRSPLKSPGGSLGSPDPARTRLFSMSPRKTPGKEPKFAPLLPPEKEEDSTQTVEVINKVQRVDKEIQCDKEDPRESETDSSDLENTLKEKSKELDDAYQKIKELEPLMKDYFSKSKQLTEAEIKVEKLSEDAEYKNKAIEDCENRVQELEVELKQLKNELEQSRIHVNKLESKEQELQLVLSEMEKKRIDICEVQTKEVEIQAVVSDEAVTKEDNEEENEIHILQSQIDEKNREIETLNKKLTTLKSGYKAKDMYFSEASEKCMELEFRINEKEIENEEFRSQVEEARKQLDMLQDVLNRKVEELARTGEELAVTSLESEKSKRILSENKARCETLTTEIRSLKEKLQAQDKVDYSSESKDCQTTFNESIIEKHLNENEIQEKELQEKIYHLQQKNSSLQVNLTAEKEKLEKALQEIENLNEKNKEKDTELSLHNQRCESSEDKSMQSEPISEKVDTQEIETLKNKLLETEHSRKDLEKKINELEHKESAFRNEIQELEGHKEEIVKLESLIKDKDSLCQELSEKVGNLTASNSELQNELKEVKNTANKVKQLESKINDYSNEIEELQSSMKDKDEKLTNATNEIKQLQIKIKENMELNFKTNNKDEELMNITNEIKHLENRIKEYSNEKDDLQNSIKDKDEKLTNATEEIKQLEKKIKDYINEIEELQNKLKDNNETKKEIKLLQAKIKYYDIKTEEFHNKMKDKDEELEMFKENLDATLLELEDKEKVKGESESLKKIVESQKEILTEREKEIKRISELYEEVDEKLKSMCNEKRKQSLEESMHDLESAVADKEMELCDKDELIQEQKSVIEKMKIDIEKLENEKKLLSESKDIADKMSQNNIKDLKEQFDNEKKALGDVLQRENEKNLEIIKTEIEEMNSRLVEEKETLFEKVENLEKSLSRLTEEKEETDIKNKSFEMEKSKLQGKLDEAWKRIYQLEDDLEEKTQQIAEMKTSDDPGQDENKDEQETLVAKCAKLEAVLHKHKEMYAKMESDFNVLKQQLFEVEKESLKAKDYLHDQISECKDLKSKVDRLSKELREKEDALTSMREANEARCVEIANERSDELNSVKDQLHCMTKEKESCMNEIENYKLKLESIQKNCDNELESVKLKLDEVFTERDNLREKVSETCCSKDNENESEVALKNVEIETLQMEVKVLKEELNRFKTSDKVVKDCVVKSSELFSEGHKSNDCDMDNMKFEELQRLYDSEKRKNEEYQKLLTETSEMHCLSPQTGVRKLRKAKIDAENALVEARYKISSLESRIKELEEKLVNTENSSNMSITSPISNDSLLQRKLNYFTNKLQDTETKSREKIADLEATIEQLERDLREERSRNSSVLEKEVHRRSSVAMIKNDPRQSVGSPSAHLEVIKIREREENMREQLKKTNETLQEWMGKMVEIENQLKQKKQELKHSQETIKNLETKHSEGERNIEKEVRHYMELSNELKLQIIKKEGDLEQKSNTIDDLQHQLENERKVIKERDSLITMFKETMQEQELMLQQQDQLISEKEANAEKGQIEYTEILEKYQQLLASRESSQKDHKVETAKLTQMEEEREAISERVTELECRLGETDKKLSLAEQERMDLEKKLKKSDDEKHRLKSALNENNHELKELEKTLTDVRKECEDLRSQGADKNAAMHLEEAKRDMEKNVHELNTKVRNLQCQNKELSFKLSSAEEKLKTLTEENKKYDKEDELQKFREERDKLVSALEACLKKKDTEIKQLKDVIKQLKDKEIQITKNWHDEREKIASGLMELQNGKVTVKNEPQDFDESSSSHGNNERTVHDDTVNHEEDTFTRPLSPQSVTRSSSKTRPPRPAPPKVSEEDTSAMIEILKASPGSARKSSARRGRKRPSPSSADDLPPLPKRSSREPLAETSVLSESSEDYSTHLQIDATPRAAARRRTRKKTPAVTKEDVDEPQPEEVPDSAKRSSKKNAKSRLLQSFRESPIGKTSKKILNNIAEKLSPTKSPSPPQNEEEPKKGRKRNKPSKENVPLEELDVPEKKTSRGRGRHKLYKEDTYISEPIENTGEFIQSPEDVHKTVTRSLRKRRN